MAKIADLLQPSVIQQIYAAHKASAKPRYSRRLGASMIGEKCERKLWYSFRWALPPEEFEPRMLRLFETGHREELRLIEELKQTGLTVEGEQFEFSATGHDVGKADGMLLGVAESPEVWHLLEIKTHSLKSFTKLKEDGMKKSKPLHYSQMQYQMGVGEIERGLYLAHCKDNDELYAERIRFDSKEFDKLAAKRDRVINSPTPPPKISESGSGFDCDYCYFRTLCHGTTQFPAKNCRTCIHSTPVANGVWNCELKREGLPYRDDLGCDQHLFIPDLLPMTLVSAGPHGVLYRALDGEEWWNLHGEGMKLIPF